jgi:hypothetical protein
MFLKPPDICAATETETEAILPILFSEAIDRPITSLFISLVIILLIMLSVSGAESVIIPCYNAIYQ